MWDSQALCLRAAKTFKPEDNGDICECALREIAFQSFLTDIGAPCIVPFLSVLQDSGADVSMLMPLMQNDIADDIENKLFKDWSCIRPVLRDVLTALAFLHGLSPPLAHRDIKPENMVRDVTGKTYLTDLGFMRFCRDGPPYDSDKPSHGSNQRGTKTYTAPEMLRHGVPHGPPVDIWATGVVGVELMRNARLNAYTDKTARKQVRQICGRMKDPMLKSLSQGMLAEDPRERWRAESVLKYAFTRPTLGAAAEAQSDVSVVLAQEPMHAAVVQSTVGDFLQRLDYRSPQTFYAACAYADEAACWSGYKATQHEICLHACIAAGKLYEHEFWSMEDIEEEIGESVTEKAVIFQQLLLQNRKGRLLQPFPPTIHQAQRHVKQPREQHSRRSKRRREAERDGAVSDRCQPAIIKTEEVSIDTNSHHSGEDPPESCPSNP